MTSARVIKFLILLVFLILPVFTIILSNGAGSDDLALTPIRPGLRSDPLRVSALSRPSPPTPQSLSLILASLRDCDSVRGSRDRAPGQTQ